MFSWFRRKPAKEKPLGAAQPSVASGQNAGAAAPFETTKGRIAFNNGQRQWEETFDCVASLVDTLGRLGRKVRAEDQRVLDEATGLWLRPVMVDMQPVHNNGVRTCTKIDFIHPTAIPSAVFEFQHSTGGTTTESIEAGFDSWAKGDLAALSDAIREKPLECTAMTFEFPGKGEGSVIRRRVILGPVWHAQERKAEQEEEHPFCPCCLLTQSMKAFEGLLNAEGFFAVRLFAMRQGDGAAGADCRVNGEEFAPGKEALTQYASQWPQAGTEFRKQYVIIQNAP